MCKEITTKSRIEWLDYFRSFGIILMIMGHIDFGLEFNHFIHAFHMPMFFFASGYCFKHKAKDQLSFPAYIKRKAESLLLPYIVFGLLHYIVYAVENIINNKPVALYHLVNLFTYNTGGLAICGALWFLTALFFADVFFFVIERNIHSKFAIIITVVLISLFGSIAKKYLSVRLPLALGASFVGIGFMYLGYIFRQNANKNIFAYLLNLKPLPLIAVSVLCAFLIIINGNVNMREGYYSNIFLFWVNAMLAIIVGINVSKIFCPLLSETFAGNIFKKIGKDSIIYLCLNELVIKYTLSLVSVLKLPTLIQNCMTFVITMVVLYSLNNLIMRTEIKIFFGK